MTAASMTLAEAAVSLAMRGFRVHPLRKRSKVPLLDKWPHLATEDPEMVRAWWRGSPQANVGISTGRGLAVLDVDGRSGGFETLAALEAKHGVLPETRTVVTGAGGRHLYFTAPSGTPSIDRLAPGLELKAEGKQVVAPPSVHPDTGDVYRWVDPDADLWPLPEWLSEPQRRGGSAAPIASEFPEGQRRTALLSLAGTMRRRGMGEIEILAALRETNRLRCAPPLEETEVEELVGDVARRYESCELPADSHPSGNGGQGAGSTTGEVTEGSAVKFPVETWEKFQAKAGEHVPCLVEGLWPVGALGFIAAPPKAGKTWAGLALALGVATGLPVFEHFTVPQAGPVLYIALEGHRAALRARVGCLARGLAVDPDGAGLRHLHFAYKPRGLNLADRAWATALVLQAEQLGAVLVVVDVLRRAAAIKENDAAEFMALVELLAPLADQGRSLLFLHHFGKLSEINRDRTAAERMAGTGAMFGALDVGLFITGSDDGARRLRLEHECRDLAEVETFGVELLGDGSGPNGGFTYQDTCRAAIGEAPGETEQKAPASELAAWIKERGGAVEAPELRSHFGISDNTERTRRQELEELGIDYDRLGGTGRYVARTDNSDNRTEATEDFGFGQIPLNHAGLSTEPKRPKSTSVRSPKEAEMQGFSTDRRPEVPTGPPSSVRVGPEVDDSEENAAECDLFQDELDYYHSKLAEPPA